MNEDDRQELVRRLFALLTAKFEDGAGLAANGQRPDAAPEAQTALANRLHALGEEIATLSDAVLAILAKA
jgi:hypothetical protein